MNATEPLIRDISDTACWAAIWRARESERKDALFRDPLARRLAGQRGEQIVETMPALNSNSWSWAIRTILFDQLLMEQITNGADMVVNLAAGLDARPYRMGLPSTLRWVEVDLPGLIAYKEEILRDEKPACALERVPLDLADEPARRALFTRLAQSAKRICVLTEGLIIYLSRDGAASLARDLAAPPGSRAWILDLVSPGLLRILQKQVGTPLREAGAPLRFGPEEGPEFFVPHGWRPTDVRSMLKATSRFKRGPLMLRFFALLPEPKGPPGNRPWGGAIALEKQEA